MFCCAHFLHARRVLEKIDDGRVMSRFSTLTEYESISTFMSLSCAQTCCICIDSVIIRKGIQLISYMLAFCPSMMDKSLHSNNLYRVDSQPVISITVET